MALTITHDSRLNKNPEMQSALARGINFSVGTLRITYSAAGGLSCSMPFSKTVFVSIPPQSGYVFEYNVTTSMLRAYMTNSSTLPLMEVASDTDFTALTAPLVFCAFGF